MADYDQAYFDALAQQNPDFWAFKQQMESAPAATPTYDDSGTQNGDTGWHPSVVNDSNWFTLPDGRHASYDNGHYVVLSDGEAKDPGDLWWQHADTTSFNPDGSVAYSNQAYNTDHDGAWSKPETWGMAIAAAIAGGEGLAYLGADAAAGSTAFSAADGLAGAEVGGMAGVDLSTAAAAGGTSLTAGELAGLGLTPEEIAAYGLTPEAASPAADYFANGTAWDQISNGWNSIPKVGQNLIVKGGLSALTNALSPDSPQRAGGLGQLGGGGVTGMNTGGSGLGGGAGTGGQYGGTNGQLGGQQVDGVFGNQLKLAQNDWNPPMQMTDPRQKQEPTQNPQQHFFTYRDFADRQQNLPRTLDSGTLGQ